MSYKNVYTSLNILKLNKMHTVYANALSADIVQSTSQLLNKFFLCSSVKKLLILFFFKSIKKHSVINNSTENKLHYC